MKKSVLITGAGSGIGLATALRLAERPGPDGFHVYATVPDVSQQAAVEAAAQARQVSLRVLLLDVTAPASIAAAIETVLAECGSLYAVVNSAGLGLRGFFEDLTDEEIRRVFDVNVFGVMNLTRAALPPMRRAGEGRIVILSSAGGRTASMSLSGYASGKFALEGFAESLMQEVLPFGVRVSLIEPGLVLTPHFTVNRGRARRAVDPYSPYYDWFVRHEEMVDRILRRNGLRPATVAGAIERALTDRHPRLRYVVGRGARLMLGLRRVLPAWLFERVYFRPLVRLITENRKPLKGLNNLHLPGVHSLDYLGMPTSEEKQR